MKTGDYVFWIFCLTGVAYSILGDFDKAAVFIVGTGIVLVLNSERKQ